MTEDVVEVAEPSKRRSWKTWHVVAASLLALFIGVGIGAATGSSGTDDTKSATPITAEETRDTVATSTTTTTEEITTTTLGSYTPTPADFALNVVVTKQSCFGSAGCNVSYEVDVAYHGPRALDSTDKWTLIYEVRGGEDVKIGNISVEGENYARDSDSISTGPGPHLVAVVTAVREG